jgi:tetratricopeptide (TPR) repeat protein
MWAMKRILLLSIIYTAINLGMLLFPATKVFGAERTELPNSAAAGRSEGTSSSGPTPTARAVAGANTPQQAAQGMIYAPRDVVDMTRLVLETNRDQTTHLAHSIDRATIIIIVFFSVLGAAGTVFGIKKVDDIERRAHTLTTSFEQAVKVSTDKVAALESDFAAKIAAAEKTIQSTVELTEANLHLEINDHMELVSARLEIEQALTRKQSVEEANRQLGNAAKRIERVLRDDRVAEQAKVRGLADLGYVRKRLQDQAGAYESINAALLLAEKCGESDPGRLALLNYNAACYACILGKAAEAIEHLAQAITYDVRWKRTALSDTDFDTLRTDTAFNALLQ